MHHRGDRYQSHLKSRLNNGQGDALIYVLGLFGVSSLSFGYGYARLNRNTRDLQLLQCLDGFGLHDCASRGIEFPVGDVHRDVTVEGAAAHEDSDPRNAPEGKLRYTLHHAYNHLESSGSLLHEYDHLHLPRNALCFAFS